MRGLRVQTAARIAKFNLEFVLFYVLSTDSTPSNSTLYHPLQVYLEDSRLGAWDKDREQETCTLYGIS
jgi:hypothetical protein